MELFGWLDGNEHDDSVVIVVLTVDMELGLELRAGSGRGSRSWFLLFVQHGDLGARAEPRGRRACDSEHHERVHERRGGPVVGAAARRADR